MTFLFNAIPGKNPLLKAYSIRCFLEHSTDFTMFKKLFMEPGPEFWTGNYISILQGKNKYMQSLLPMLTGLDFLEHRKYVEDPIDSCHKQIHLEKIKDLLDKTI